MQDVDFSAMSDQELASVFQRFDLEKTRKALSQISLDQLPVVLSLFQLQFDPDWEDKLYAAFKVNNDRQWIQIIARQLTLKQFRSLLISVNKDLDNHEEKLKGLVMHLRQSVFEEVLRVATDKELHPLQAIVGSEPIHFQLTMFVHSIEQKVNRIDQQRELLAKEIGFISVTSIKQEEIDQAVKKIEELARQVERALKKVQNALLLAWGMGNKPLIEVLTHHTESWMAYLHDVIGEPRYDEAPPQGLYALLDAVLFQLFQKGEKRELLLEGDSALDGLGALRIWRLEHYCEVGLLWPQGITSVEELNQSFELLSSEERKEKELSYQIGVERTLDLMGLRTVGDLITKRIYTKEALERFVRSGY